MRHGEDSAAIELVRWTRARSETPGGDLVAREEPLEIRVQGRCIAVTMRTPGHDAELAAGFLLSEGVIESRAQILEIAPCHQPQNGAGNILNVYLAAGLEVDFERLSRHVFATSSCGLCGKTSIDSLHQRLAPVTRALEVRASVLLELPGRLRAAQQAFARTGGLHAAGVFGADGALAILREDVGRHNAVDKVIGAGILTGNGPYDGHVLLVSGRASFEIVQKALAARIPVVAAISAPSSLAVELARESGQTLVGFLREDSFNVYAGEERVRG